MSATTLPDTTPPPAPAGLTATVASSAQINLSWNIVSDNGGSGVAGYKIERCQGANCSDFTQIRAQTGSTYQDTDRTASTTYLYRVRAYDNAGNNSTSYSNVVTAATTADTDVPAAPSNLLAVASSSTKIDLSWTASADSGGSGLAGYKIERCQGASCSSYAQIATSPTNNYADTTVAANTTYVYRVRAYDNAGNNSTAYSNVANATTPQDATNPTAPATLTAAAASSTQVNLSWAASTDAGGNLAGYKIERCQNAGCTSFSPLATVLVSDPAGRTYANSNLSPITTYLYRVYAYDSAGNNSSGYSPTASATTPTDTTAPSNPTITVSTASSTQLNVSWSASTDIGGSGLAGYKVERCQGAGCSSFTQIASLGSTTTSYPNSGLGASTTYVYRVRAYDSANPANHSGYSISVSGTTSADTIAPTAPGSLSGSAASGTQINLNWQGSTDAGGSGLAGYKIERCTGAGCSNFAQVNTTGATSYPNSGLTDATTYGYRVRAYDGAGINSGYSNAVSITTPDVTRPVVTNLVFNGVTAHEATAHWNGSDNKRVASYQYSRDGGSSWAPVGLIQDFPLTGLASTVTYSLWVRAFDDAGNVSTVVSGSFKTLDDIGPTIPSLSMINITVNAATASWGTATDNPGGAGVTGYLYTLYNSAGTPLSTGNITSTSVGLTGLTQATNYTFEVKAYDARNNVGPAQTRPFTTQAPPPRPTGLGYYQNADCAWTAYWGASAGATYYIFRDISGDYEQTVSGRSVVYTCPWGQAASYKPKWVQACSNWGCSVKANF